LAARTPYDSLTLRAVTDELRRALLGGVVQHVAQPIPTDLIFTIRNSGANHSLLLSCDATYARAHLTHIKRPNPLTPFAFLMLCRKYVEGTRVLEVRQRGFDRILDIDLGDSDGPKYRLIAELMGKHSNVLLTTADHVILDAAKRITKKQSRVREVLPGKPYLAPPVQEGRIDPFTFTTEQAADFGKELPADPEARLARIMGRFEGISPFLAEELIQRTAAGSFEEAWDEIFGAAKRRKWMPVVVRNEKAEPVGAYPFPSVQFPASVQNSRDSINTALDHYYSIALPRAALDAARHELTTSLERALKARRKQLESVERSLQEAGRAEVYKQSGELLLGNLHQIEPQAESVTVIDYYAEGSPERAITLDPLKSPKENVEAYFKRYRKAKDGAERQREQLERTQGDIRSLEEGLLKLKEAKDLAAIKALRAELTGANLLRGEQSADTDTTTKKGPDFQGKKIRIFHTPDGWEIYVGENSEANDFLTSKVASPNDYWLHVRANTSAHVVIRTRNSPGTVPQSVIRQAALLAARHSAAKHSAMVPVDYTLKKYVRRPRGAASGAALYQNEKTIYVSPKD
jgi:predicted ribosome quality control (RQC) complex YloA/Tae2 family protein